MARKKRLALNWPLGTSSIITIPIEISSPLYWVDDGMNDYEENYPDERAAARTVMLVFSSLLIMCGALAVWWLWMLGVLG